MPRLQLLLRAVASTSADYASFIAAVARIFKKVVPGEVEAAGPATTFGTPELSSCICRVWLAARAVPGWIMVSFTSLHTSQSLLIVTVVMCAQSMLRVMPKNLSPRCVHGHAGASALWHDPGPAQDSAGTDPTSRRGS